MNIAELIIERPQSQSFTQRWTSNLLTTIAWGLMFYGLLPIAGLFVGRHFLPEMPLDHNVTSIGAWGSLVPLLPWWGLCAVFLIAALYIWATVQYIRFRNSRRNAKTAQVTVAEMAAHCGHPEEVVASWGEARRAVAHYDDAAVMVEVSTALDEPFREHPVEGEVPAPVAPPAPRKPARQCAESRETQMRAELAELRVQLVNYWGRVESIESLMRDIAENRGMREPNRDVVLYARLKMLREALLARIKRTKEQSAEMRYLVEEHAESLAALTAKSRS